MEDVQLLQNMEVITRYQLNFPYYKWENQGAFCDAEILTHSQYRERWFSGKQLERSNQQPFSRPVLPESNHQEIRTARQAVGEERRTDFKVEAE